ncbi:uncharacterized protein LOC114358018 [Ostrinia furnacalis]|uniref:uncharacterized protein LOC114358018 n=2 Tax=Ostrinia furnacalis TaxID=93504 RepID=UPI00103BAD98|nr:uncharacterized protein LOC114358018 [Ostrinia furnacalis]XP_028167676.1 uncharacterized protein LOC114358018 [Ostrinia furnacalis]
MSPVPYMSPSTLDLYQTLSGIHTPIQEYPKDLNEVDLEEENVLNRHFSTPKNNTDNISDFSADTDTDYVPDSNSDSSDDDTTVTSRKINIVAIVHSNDTPRKGHLITRLQDTNVSHVHEGTTVRGNSETIESLETIYSIQSDNGNNVENFQNYSNPGQSPTSDSLIPLHTDFTHITDSLQNEAVEPNTEENFVEDSNTDQILSSVGRPKKGRKRKHPEFTIAQAKTRKYKNKSYLTKKKYVDPKVFHDYSCSCQKKCYQLVSLEKRQEEFEKFVTLGSYEAQALYIAKTVRENKKTRSYTVLKGNKSGKKRPREYTRTYSLCGIDVCRDMYINNFQITTKKVDISLKKNRSGSTLQDQRGKQGGGWNKTKVHEVEFIKNIINKLPQYESHYRRDQTNGCKFLKLGMTVQAIYDLYLEEFNKSINTDPTNPKKPVSFSTLKRIFYDNFNLRCKSLRKDTCNKCDTLSIKIKNCTSDVERKQYQEEKEIHLKRAEELRRDMKEDMMKAKTEDNFECITFDMEKTLPLPRIPTSVVFYKRQLWFYNCSVHTGSDNIGHCYVWVEGEAGRGSQEVGSCISKYIKHKLDPKVEHLVLWSDCCGGQNRNIKIVLMLKAVLNSHPTLKTITFKYLESGHTFLPNDTDFSKIETMLKYHERIYTVKEYINIIKNCKKQHPLQVYRMEKNDFMGTKTLEKNTVNRKLFVSKEKVNWLKTKVILIDKDDKFHVYMKADSDNFNQLNIEKKLKGKSFDINEKDLVLLWPNGKVIPQPKLDDLMSMLDLIPKDCQDFYKSLKGSSNIVEDIEGYDGDLDFIPEESDD